MGRTPGRRLLCSAAASAVPLAAEQESASATAPSTPRKKWLRASDVADRFGLHRSTLYRKVAAGQFPKPVRLAGSFGQHGGAVAWPESEILEYERTLIAARDEHFARAAKRVHPRK